jgi:aspartate kinase
MKVFKFGGASVKNAASVENVKHIISLFSEEELLIVVSAMDKTTNAMEEIVQHYFEGKTKESISAMEERKTFHFSIMQELFSSQKHPIFDEISAIFNDLREKLEGTPSANFDFEYDQIVSLGEVLSTKIIAAYLNDHFGDVSWQDARELVRTNNNYRYADIDWKKTQELITTMWTNKGKNSKLITQGFLGHTSEGLTTTLGREGSDFTAGIFAYCLDSESVTIWKDVPGMLNADPKWFDNTVKLDKISFKEAIELSYYGASVIHPKTIKPLQNKNIPLYVKSFLEPEKPGTVIQRSTENDDIIPSFIFKMNQVLLSITPKDFSFVVEENLSDIFKALAEVGARINVMQNSAVSFSVCLDISDYQLAQLNEKLSDSFIIKYNKGLELVTIRHYDQVTIDRVTINKDILMEQKTRQTVRIVMKNIAY